jgi:DMSO/TMAO reductase YedYZ molybdopterin-dependent catalytic subunit
MRANSTFEINGWDEIPGDEIPNGHKLSRATVKKTFRGDLEGTSTAELLLSKGPKDSAAYVALERIDGRLADRSGTFLLMHSALADAKGQHGDWRIVPGSGTGGLRGLSGRAEYRHDSSGASFTLDYEVE